jgi:hypothetical protein
MLPGQSNQRLQQLLEKPLLEMSPLDAVTEVELKKSRFNLQQVILADHQPAIDPTRPGGRVCEWCCNFFDYRPRPPGEVERLQQTLHITGPAVARVPVCCDGCYDSVTTSALRNERVMDGVGVSNSGPPNLTLRMQRP